MDRDLASIQEVRDKMGLARQAADKLAKMSQQELDKLAEAVSRAGQREARRLGELAFRETGYGKPEDKERKNRFAACRVWERIRQEKIVGVLREDT